MPRQTEREQAAEALFHAYMASLISESETCLDNPPSDSEDDTDTDSLASSSDSDSDEALEPMSGFYLDQLSTLYSRRYLADRSNTISKSTEDLTLLLQDWKISRPEIFRSYVRVSPSCFDAILAAIEDDPIFHNNSQNQQDPIDRQLAVTLHRLGHYGNAASTLKVALWAGVGYGTVRLYTNRVMVAVCRERFRRSALRWPDDATKEKAKQWVEEASCPAWRHGWLMVDGTLVPLFQRPGFYGNTWFDRKHNYSMNVQTKLISTPDLRIIDYGVGLPGSQHDATAWAETRIPQEHDLLLDENEWVWADSAYPLEKWCQAPYKKQV
ncbi:hypothetical protein BV22DRAFT_1124096 [Leucogyrophana mollusca]|uniref:Uncharacterized protein n=1 Tax=Leucogyrophana mollusca TaxID=85980 RepID=A0ACB8ATR2_9AGAM|nr:hypothetical protein BV22DRAFT_1124096 [Leucogyrophana mollusca]